MKRFLYFSFQCAFSFGFAWLNQKLWPDMPGWGFVLYFLYMKEALETGDKIDEINERQT